MTDLDRRKFLQLGAAGAAGGLSLAGPLQAFLAGSGRVGAASGYGPLEPKADHITGLELLALPAGFEYWSFSPEGGTMSDGTVPGKHDGMASYRAANGRVRLVRNHEIALGTPLPGTAAFDPTSGGGTVTVLWDPATKSVVDEFASLGGTRRNCAGGRTPWGSWLSCEETTDPGHGYVFEVPAAGHSTAEPLTAMGRFAHEAIAVDPATSIVYETEDAGSTSGFYRFVPNSPKHLAAGGKLQMLMVKGKPAYDAFVGQRVGKSLRAVWVDVDDPDGATSTFEQGRSKGGAAFRRLEGAWWSPADRAVYFNSTDGGDAASGQVWAFRPSGGMLTLVYESPSSATLLKPDNLTVSPRNGILLCEDTDRARQTFLKGVTADGVLYDFAANIREGLIPGTTTPQSWDEFAGATFSADGKWLFVNIQTPGISLAITGPWRKGDL